MNSEVMYRKVSLESLGGGAVVEKFNDALVKVLDNIRDPNTSYKFSREINIKIAIEPNEERNKCELTINVTAKLASYKPYGSIMFIGEENGELQAIESGVEEQALPFGENLKKRTGGENA